MLIISEKYVTKADILEWIQELVPEITDIPNRIMTKGHSLVYANLVNTRVFEIPDAVDEFGFLREAASCFILSLCCRARLISQTNGEMLTDKFGEVTYQFQQTGPGRFYVRTGSIEYLTNLAPYKSFEMMGRDFVFAYKNYYYFYKKRGLLIPKGVVVKDKTSRGAFWNRDVSEIELADSVYGDIDPEGRRFAKVRKPRWY